METLFAAIKVLYRAPDSLALWGLPYELRPGQQPRDIYKWRGGGVPAEPWVERPIQHQESVPRFYGPGPGPAPWVFLGYPGWWGDLPREQTDAIQKYLQTLECIPGNPYEWVEVQLKSVA